jgi:hypothetical protein
MGTMDCVENIKDGDEILAIVIRGNKDVPPGLSFITPGNFPLQVGMHNQKAGTHSPAHAHVPIIEQKDITAQEIFFIKSGKIKVGLYNKKDKHIKDVILGDNDLILIEGGHSVDFLEDTQLYECKQGPYRGKDREKRMIG